MRKLCHESCLGHTVTWCARRERGRWIEKHTPKRRLGGRKKMEPSGSTHSLDQGDVILIQISVWRACTRYHRTVCFGLRMTLPGARQALLPSDIGDGASNTLAQSTSSIRTKMALCIATTDRFTRTALSSFSTLKTSSCVQTQTHNADHDQYGTRLVVTHAAPALIRVQSAYSYMRGWLPLRRCC